jgi:hypothetical protein
MPAPVAAYAVAITMLLLCGACALVLMRMIDHFDAPEARELPEHRHETVGV